jgi:phosphoglycerol transferase MdoB-like AlkP superfamily enzyme
MAIKREPVATFLSKISGFQMAAIFTGLFFTLVVPSGLYNDLSKFSTNWKTRSHLVTTSEKYGFMTAFVRNLIHASESNKPIGYNKQTIESILSNLKADPITSSGSTDRINLIVYLVESFIDPSDFNIETTSDPIPFFHQLQAAHQSGYVYSPEYGGRSANAEFELLTGFTIHFFQPYVIPFIDLPYREIPSIAHELKNINYHTQVIQAASLGYFNYQQMYEMLGFDEILSLDGDKHVALDIAGRYPSDFAVVDNIIQTAKVSRPYFIYAFPNSTHGAWNYDHYLKSDLDITNKPLSSKKGERHLKTYINALNKADQAIQKLIEHFEQQKQKTVILILGDHQPGIPELLEQQMFNEFPQRFTEGRRKKMAKQFMRFDENNPLASYDIMHKVPYVIWTNFNQNFQQNTQTIGMNELVIMLFNQLNHDPVSPFYQFLAEFIEHTSHNDILKHTQTPLNQLSSTVKQWILSYQQLQYDFLLGEEYANQYNN